MSLSIFHEEALNLIAHGFISIPSPENVEAYDMIESLKSMFQAQAKTERYQVSQALLAVSSKTVIH